MAPGEAHVDATCGAGGYTRAMLAHGSTVIAFDRDPDAIAEGRALVAESGDRLILVEAPFSALDREREARDLAPVDGVPMDIGVSSMQLDRRSEEHPPALQSPMRIAYAAVCMKKNTNNIQ